MGREIVRTVHAEGARVLAVARDQRLLERLAGELVGANTLAIDATDELAPTKVLDVLDPDILIVCAGAIPPTAPLHEQEWREFSINWETDVKASFLFCKAALRRPLKPGSMVILISSGAATGGSPISGGYAGAKRMQMFMANYCQKESDRLALGLRFFAVAPARIMPETRLGEVAVAGYSRYLGMSSSQFLQSMSSRQTPQDLAKAIVELANSQSAKAGMTYTVSDHGIDPRP